VSVSHESESQFWTLEGCSNFRDVGGYASAFGTRVRPRQLYRSDALSAASPSDREILAGLRIATVVDLRVHAEIEIAGRYPDRRPAYFHLPLGNPVNGAGIGWSEPEQVAARYFELLLDGRDSIGETLAVLTDPAAYPAVIHCSVGKDRTGIVMALILSLLGVADHDIVADYALSGIGTARLVLRLRDELGDRFSELEPFLPVLLSAEPDSMRIFLARLRSEFGSVDGYVEHIGLASATEYLRAALLEQASARFEPAA
jgi:protein tyrosine/serine phosphatase